MPVIAHISGPSGSGKTTLGNKIKSLFPQIIVQDLDIMDDVAANKLFGAKSKKDYTDNDIKALANLRQKLLNKFIQDNNKKK